MSRAKDLLKPQMRDCLSRVIAVDAPKGGVGKSSFAVQVAALLAEQGLQVLLATWDAQDDIGDDLGYAADGLNDDGAAFRRALETGEPLQPSLRDVRPGLDVVCGGDELIQFTKFLAGEDFAGRLDWSLFARVLAPTAAQYDFVILDSAPNEDTMRRLMLNATKWVIVPVSHDTSSQKSLGRLVTRFMDARNTNPGLMLLGVVLFRLDQSHSKIRRDVHEQMTTVIDGSDAPVFKTVIRNAAQASRDVREIGKLPHELAAMQARRGFRTKINPTVKHLANDYIELTKEVLDRVLRYEKEHTNA